MVTKLMNQKPMLQDIILHKQSHTLELTFDDGTYFVFPWEYLRVFSPSKEVRARFGRGRILVFDKENVKIDRITPIGNYAIKIFFDDGHHSGLYDWQFLYELGIHQDKNWKEHLERVATERP